MWLYYSVISVTVYSHDSISEFHKTANLVSKYVEINDNATP